jgi:hypothetical protein
VEKLLLDGSIASPSDSLEHTIKRAVELTTDPPKQLGNTAKKREANLDLATLLGALAVLERDNGILPAAETAWQEAQPSIPAAQFERWAGPIPGERAFEERSARVARTLRETYALLGNTAPAELMQISA